MGVGNGLDAKKREGASGQVGNEYSVRNVSTRHKGVRGFRSVLDASWLRMEPEGSGVHC